MYLGRQFNAQGIKLLEQPKLAETSTINEIINESSQNSISTN